jgi:hypothetical protein
MLTLLLKEDHDHEIKIYSLSQMRYGREGPFIIHP